MVAPNYPRLIEICVGFNRLYIYDQIFAFFSPDYFRPVADVVDYNAPTEIQTCI